MKSARFRNIACVVAIVCLTTAVTIQAQNVNTRAGAGDRTPPNSPPTLFQLEATLTSSTSGLNMGWSVAIQGNVIASVDAAGVAIDLFIGSDGVWTSGTETAQLTASDGNGFNAVAISGNTIVAGSESADGSGATYVFVEPSGGWTNMTETAKLIATGAQNGDRVGSAVAIADNTIVVGAYENDSTALSYPLGPGTAYVYEKPVNGWANMSQTAEIDASDGQDGDDFGYSVAIAGDSIAVAAPQASANGNPLVGAVYVFQKTGPHWKSITQTAKMFSSDNTIALGLGAGMYGTTIAACSYNATYLFIEPANGWVSGPQSVELQGSGPNGSGLNSVAISSRYVLAGAPEPFGGSARALGFIEPANGWVNEMPSNIFQTPTPSSRFGWSVAVGDKTVVIGAPDLGHVYVVGLQ